MAQRESTLVVASWTLGAMLFYVSALALEGMTFALMSLGMSLLILSVVCSILFGQEK